MSQMTVSQMSLTETTDSPQHRQHWLAEQALNWSGLPVVHVRPTVFLQHFFFLALGRRVDRPRRHDPAALRLRADVAGRHAGRRRGDRGHPGEPGRAMSARSTS